MEWIKLPIDSVLRHPDMLGEDPVLRACYMYLLAMACSQECGGRLSSAALWPDRKWQQVAGVTKGEVDELCRTPLATVDGDDIVLWWYPQEQEEAIAAKRANGRRGGRPRSQLAAKKPCGLAGEKPHGLAADNHVASHSENRVDKIRVDKSRAYETARATGTDDFAAAVTAELPSTPVSDEDRWRMEISGTEWARAIKRAGGKIGANNWTQWEEIMQTAHGGSVSACVAAIKDVAPDDRWPDKVEAQAARANPVANDGRKVVIL